MVKIEELKGEDTDDGFITESDISSDSGLSDAEKFETKNADDDDIDDKELERSLQLYDIQNETIGDRIYALRDIINPSTRAAIRDSCNSIYRSTSSTFKTLGNVAWVVTTSMILVGLPMALSIEGESMLVAHEKEVERQQHGQQTLLGVPGSSPGGNSLNTDQHRTAITPTGF